MRKKIIRFFTDTYPPIENMYYWADVGFEILQRFLHTRPDFDIWALSLRGGQHSFNTQSRWSRLFPFFYHATPCPKNFYNVVCGPANLLANWTTGVPNILITGDWGLRNTLKNDTIPYSFSTDEKELISHYDLVLNCNDVDTVTFDTIFCELTRYIDTLEDISK